MFEDLKEIEKRFEIKDFPLNVGIEITNNCNLNCVMCNNDKLTRPRGYMDMKLYKKIIDEISVMNPNTRIWLDFYGEALLVGYKLYYMIDYAKKRGLTNVCINTNGTLLNYEMADMLLDSGIDFISIDCYGFSKESFESISIGANRDTVYNNIEYILKEKQRRNLENVIIEIKTMEMEQNKGEVDQIIDYWRERGAWTTLRRLITWGGSVEDVKHQELSERVACGSGLGIFIVTWDGRVPTCVSDIDIENCLGDINVDSISSIWKKRNECLIDKHMQHKWDELPLICQRCTDWSIVGEKRWDDKGNEIIKSYKHNSKMITVND